MNPRTGLVTRSTGETMTAEDLVAQLRRYRGRLTRRELCRAIGWDADNKQDMNTINRVCTRWGIAAATNGIARN